MCWKSWTALAVLVGSSASAQTDLELARLRSYTNHRASSYDRSGANDDGNWNDPIKVGETRTLAELEGPAVILRRLRYQPLRRHEADLCTLALW